MRVKLMHQTNNFWPTPLGLIQKYLGWIASNTKVTAAFWYSLEVLHQHMLPHNRGLQWELFKPDTYRTITYTEYKRCHMIICQVPVTRQLFPQQTFKISLSSIESSTKSSTWTTGKWCASTSGWLDLLSEHTHFSPTRALGLRSLISISAKVLKTQYMTRWNGHTNWRHQPLSQRDSCLCNIALASRETIWVSLFCSTQCVWNFTQVHIVSPWTATSQEYPALEVKKL